MNLIVTTAIALTIVFPAYMIITDRKVGTSYSISDSWYSWRSVKKSYMFIVFLACVMLGLWFVVDFDGWKSDAAPLLLTLGGFFAWMIGVAANFKQTKSIATYHNVFSVLCFACVLVGFAIQGITFPLVGFAIICAALAPIKIEKKTTVIESIGIGLSIAAIYYL